MTNSRTYGSAIPYGIDINQLGASDYSRIAINAPAPYQDAVIEDIITNEDHELYAIDGSNVGQAKIRLLPGDLNVPTSQLNWANPIESNFQEYPLKNEIVMIFYCLGQLYYTRKISITRKITENSWPGVARRFGTTSVEDQQTSVQLASLEAVPINKSTIQDTFNLGTYFKEHPTARPLRHYEGDLIIQGRFGNSIRFGSSQFSNKNTSNPQPNILISVGQTIPMVVSTQTPTNFSLTRERINDDKSSIWLVSDDTVKFYPKMADSTSQNRAHLRSSTNRTKEYTGAQIFVNSDRVILNSQVNEISLFSSKEINLSATKHITIDTESSIYLSSNSDVNIASDGNIILSGKKVAILGTENLSYKTSGNYSILGKKIFIGSSNDSSQPMVLGATLAVFLQEILKFIQTPGSLITTTGPVFVGPTGIILLTQLFEGLGMGFPASAVFNSSDNFVTDTNNV